MFSHQKLFKISQASAGFSHVSPGNMSLSKSGKELPQGAKIARRMENTGLWNHLFPSD